MKIPQCNPHASYLAQQEEIDTAIKRVLDSGSYILGRECEAFECEFADYIGVRNAVGVATGTDALILALKACGVMPGDEVITVAHTAVATVSAIVMTGAVPVYVDIDPMTYTMNPANLKKVLTKKTKVIIPVHIYGMPADMPAIMEFAREHDLKVIEDCAQAHGAGIVTEGGRRKEEGGSRRSVGAKDFSPVPGRDERFFARAGTFGDVATFSFYPTKNLGTFGDGGMVVTDKPRLAEALRELRQYGWRERYISSFHGWNSRLDELHAAILRVKLKELDKANNARRKIAAIYDELLSNSGVVTPYVPEGFHHVYHQYVIQHINREWVREKLAENGVGTAIHYPAPVNLQPAYFSNDKKGSRLPNTEILYSAILSLPIYPEMSLDDAEYVANAICG